jgi:hypothetical protein
METKSSRWRCLAPWPLRGAFARIALVDIGHLDALAGGGLHGLGQAPDLGAVVRTGRRHVQSRQVTQYVDRPVQLGTLLPLGAVISGPRVALRRGTECPAVQDGSAGLYTA